MSDVKPNEPVTSAEPASSPSKAEAIAKIIAMKAELKRLEATTGPSGAMSNTPTAMILDASVVQTKNPDKRYRWVHVNKVQRRQVEGYETVPSVEGGKQVGNLILMALSREVYEARVAAIDKRTQERTTAHNREMEEAAEGLAKYLRDSGKLNVRAEDLLVKG